MSHEPVEPALTGDPHVDARLEAWRPGGRVSGPAGRPLDALPAPGRERRARFALAAVAIVAIALLSGYVLVAVLGAAAGR